MAQEDEIETGGQPEVRISTPEWQQESREIAAAEAVLLAENHGGSRDPDLPLR